VVKPDQVRSASFLQIRIGIQGMSIRIQPIWIGSNSKLL
jgi:hypothetical protein